MTTFVAPAATPPMLPGWSLVADLTPPELIERRRLRVLRRLVLAGIAVVAVLCVAGYVFAMLRHAAADVALQAEQQRTLQLQHQASKYAGITRIQTTVKGVDSNVAKVMAGDVDASGFITELAKARPGDVALSNVAVTLFPANGTKSSGQSSSQTVNMSGHPLIGTVTMSGTAGSLPSVASYVDRISKLPGVVGVLPTSSERDASGVQFNIKFSVNDQLFSHKFDVNTQAGH